MSDDLAAFIAARLDEDEVTARAAADQGATAWALSGPWDLDDDDEDEERPACQESCAVYAGTEVMIYDEGTPSVQEALHIVQHDPARVITEVAVKRAILNAWQRERDGGFGGSGFTEGLETAVRHLAAVWSGHPDYREEWKPL